MQLSFEKSVAGRRTYVLPAPDVPKYELPAEMRRTLELPLPEMGEPDINRHYSALERRSFGVNDGPYPLGSCTMKYNPIINDQLASLPGFTQIHPLQEIDTVQGCLQALVEAEKFLAAVTGMDRMTFQPAAGAHGEFTALLMVKAYHEDRGDSERTQIIVPDSAHGTNPASAAMAGFETVNIPSNEAGGVDLDGLKKVLGPKTAGLMLTNPNTLGIFDPNIEEITALVHEAGGLNYYDGANLNAVMGVARPGDMGFDLVHLNLHKTFSTPHGGGGPGSGPVGCKAFLAKYLPNDMPIARKGEDGEDVYDLEVPEKTIGRVRSFYGNFLVTLKAYAYALRLGKAGIREAALTAVLNANYMAEGLKDYYDISVPGPYMHEFVLTIEPLRQEYGITAMDIAKAIQEKRIHPPTMYFPLNVKEALMVEPTETESRETLDMMIEALREIRSRVDSDPESLRQAPRTTVIGRPDETTAARNPILRYTEPEAE